MAATVDKNLVMGRPTVSSGRSGRSGRQRVPAEPDTSSLVLFEHEDAEEVDAQSFFSEEARWRSGDAGDIDPLYQLSLGGMMNGMGLNEMNDKG